MSINEFLGMEIFNLTLWRIKYWVHFSENPNKVSKPRRGHTMYFLIFNFQSPPPMLSNRRRWVLIIASVGLGSVIAAIFLKYKKGTMDAQTWQSLFINFLFALAIVFSIGILLQKMNKDKNV
jgi:hypothetical protein